VTGRRRVPRAPVVAAFAATGLLEIGLVWAVVDAREVGLLFTALLVVAQATGCAVFLRLVDRPPPRGG
jgi:hypothetical protein